MGSAALKREGEMPFVACIQTTKSCQAQPETAPLLPRAAQLTQAIVRLRGAEAGIMSCRMKWKACGEYLRRKGRGVGPGVICHRTCHRVVPLWSADVSTWTTLVTSAVL